jgi:hypothetical protein
MQRALRQQKNKKTNKSGSVGLRYDVRVLASKKPTAHNSRVLRVRERSLAKMLLHVPSFLSNLQWLVTATNMVAGLSPAAKKQQLQQFLSMH